MEYVRGQWIQEDSYNEGSLYIDCLYLGVKLLPMCLISFSFGMEYPGTSALPITVSK